MSQYYLSDGENQTGPFSAEELKERNISRDQFIWKEGMADWTKADELPELNFVIKEPPAFKASYPTTAPPESNTGNTNIYAASTAETNGRWIGRNFKWIALILLITTVGFMVYNNKNGDTPSLPEEIVKPFIRDKTPEEIRADLKTKEESDPTQYLEAKLTYRKNFIDETVIEGDIHNSASIASFKNVVIEVSFLSKTDAVLGTKTFTVYERINPQQQQKIKKIKIYAPDQTQKLSVNVVGAEAN